MLVSDYVTIYGTFNLTLHYSEYFAAVPFALVTASHRCDVDLINRVTQSCVDPILYHSSNKFSVYVKTNKWKH